MKIKLIILALIVMMFVGACVKNLSTDSCTISRTESKEYSDNKLGFNLWYPQTWFIWSSPATNILLIGNIDPRLNITPTTGVQGMLLGTYTSKEDAEKQIQDLSQAYNTTKDFEMKKLIIDGRYAVLVSYISPEICTGHMGPGGVCIEEQFRYQLNIVDGLNVIALSAYAPKDADASLKCEIEGILTSIQFQ